jgi:hypothetical protein
MASSKLQLQSVAIVTALAFTIALARPALAAQPAEGEPAPAPSTPPPPPSPPGDSDVRLIVRSDAPGTKIQRLSGTLDLVVGYRGGVGQLWTDLCIAPCDRTVTSGDQLRAGGLGIALSEPFLVPPGKDITNVSIKTASQDSRTAGYVVTSIGAFAAVMGLGLILGGSLLRQRER